MEAEAKDEITNVEESDHTRNSNQRKRTNTDIAEGRVGKRGDFRRRGANRGNMLRGYGYGDPVAAKLFEISGPTTELSDEQTEETRFSGRCRLYIGNIGDQVTEQDLTEMLEKFGEIHDLFYNSQKSFAFLRMDTRENAARAKRELDGRLKGDKAMKVRFAPHQSALKVKNLGPWISNELLKLAFSVFGKIERAVVFSDDRGHSKGEGIVEFERKGSCMEACRRVNQGCFLLSSSPRPIVAELAQDLVDEDGLMEKNLPQHSSQFEFERGIGPRFADYNSIDCEFGEKWKDLYEYKKLKEAAIGREMILEEERLMGQMEFARYKHDTEQLRQQLKQREQVEEYNQSLLESREKEWEQRLEEEKNGWNEREKQLVVSFKKRDERIHGGGWNKESEGCEDGNLSRGFQNKSDVGDKGEIKIYDNSEPLSKVEEPTLDSFQNKKLFDEKVATIKPGDKWDADRKGGPPKNPRELLGLA